MVSVIYAQFKSLPDSWYNQDRINLYKRLMQEATLFDKEADQPDCESPEKEILSKHLDEMEDQFIENEYRGADHD